jgi:hypothetical protein
VEPQTQAGIRVERDKVADGAGSVHQDVEMGTMEISAGFRKGGTIVRRQRGRVRDGARCQGIDRVGERMTAKE